MKKNNKKVIKLVGLLAIIGFSLFLIKKVNIFSLFFQPSTSIAFKKESSGCGDIRVFKTNTNNTIGISVYANKNKLKLSSTKQTFNIGKTDGLDVEILIGENIEKSYCTDFLGISKIDNKLIGKSGKATIFISDIREEKSKWKNSYNANVILENVRFVDKDGIETEVTINKLIFKDITVGWYPG